MANDAKLPAIQRFIDSLEEDEKALLDGYLQSQTFEKLSKNLEQLLEIRHAPEENNS